MVIDNRQRFRSRFQQGQRVRDGFGYDAVETGEGKRRQPSGIVRGEDDELTAVKRRKLLSQTRDLSRNFSVLGWALRRHLDYITNFNFQPKTSDRKLNLKLADFIETWSQPENFDVSGINPLWNFIRLAEVRRCIDGDILALKLADGRVQAIEGDRLLSPVATAPRAIAARNWFHGVELDGYGRHLAYAVHRRAKSNDFGAAGSSRFEFERAVPAQQALLFAHRERFDQVRGITPLTAAINSLVDTYEGFDFLMAKLKAHSQFALAIMRGDPKAVPDANGNYDDIVIGKRPIFLDMQPGERAEFLESKTPATETQAFLELQVQLTLKAMDIPFSFFRENFTNYSGARQALVMYNEAAKIKRRGVLWLLNGLTRWRLQLAVLDRQLPQRVLDPYMWEWIPTGVPWIDPLKEMQANAAGLALGVTSKTRICRANGLDYEEILDENVADKKLEEERGLTFDVATAAATVAPARRRSKKAKPQTAQGGA